MDYETEEQQVEALKQWWKDNGRSVIVGIVLGVGVIGGWQAYGSYNESKALEASDRYAEVLEALNDESTRGQAVELAETLQDEQGDSLYATLASMAAARALIEAGDLDGASEKLQWAVDNSPQPDVKELAVIRLARVLGANDEVSEALSVLPVNPSAAYVGFVEDIRGDLLVKNGDIDAARAAYQKALDNQDTAPMGAFIRFKLDDLAVAADQS